MQIQIAQFIGKTFTEIEGAEPGSDTIDFKASDGTIFRMYHSQDCCENVSVEDVVGDLADLLGSPIVRAEEPSSDDEPAPDYAESFTWTFYILGTAKGTVTLRWLGTSNGYYSESVYIEKVEQTN